MLRFMIMTGVLAGLTGTVACDHGKEPPPQVNAGFEAGGRMMVPLDVPSRQHDRGIVDTMRRRVIELDKGHIVRDQSRGVYE